jgi:hypothetical protein
MIDESYPVDQEYVPAIEDSIEEVNNLEEEITPDATS